MIAWRAESGENASLIRRPFRALTVNTAAHPLIMLNTTLKYLHLTPDSALPELDGMGQFQAIVVLDADVAEMTMWDISRGLIESGCMLALVWGKSSAAWGEAIEDAALEAVDYEDVPDERAIIVTAYDAEDELDEVFWYARHRAAHPALVLRETLIIHIAAAPRREELEAAYHAA